MLTPEQMDVAGEYVATTYRQIEAELIEYLVAKMIEGDVAGQRVQTAINLLTQSMPLELKGIIDSHANEIDAAVVADVRESMAASDAFDLKIIADALGLTLAEEALTAQTASVLASVREMVARDNLALSQAARAKFLQWSTWAATQAVTGTMTVDKAMHKAVRELSRGGLSIPFVTYKDEKTGKTTVTNHVDVAVQRHLRSLIGQGAAQLTFNRMQEAGIEFVEVSSHIGSRPSHCEWQGRCYHVGGAIEVDGVRYEDFEFSTGYRGVCGPFTALGDQLLGVNCRHSFAPWVPGSPRAYHPDPESPTGLDNAEIYDLTQKQRYRERKIREAKRELKAAQQMYNKNPSPENAAEVTKAKLLLQKRQAAMRKFIDESNAKCNKGTKALVRQPRREWAGDMPKGATLKAIKENRKVSSGLSEKLWAEQFENEVLTAKLPDGSTFEKIGTPIGVDLTEEEVELLHGADLAHTHTTTIGGTFSWEDIELTVITESPHHVVTDVLKKKKYELTRTSKATQESSSKFFEDFKANELFVRGATEIEMWKSEYAPYGLAFDAAGRRKALLVVKSEMHKWLKSNAKTYGYVYSFGRAK